MLDVLAPVLPLFGLIAVGVLAGRAGVLGPDAVDPLNRFVVYLALPALLFVGTAEAGLAALVASWRFAAAFALALGITYALALLLAPRDRPLADRSIEALACAYPNAGFMGIPLVLDVLGKRALPLAIVSALLTVCALFALAIAAVELDRSGGSAAAAPGQAAGRIARVLGRNPILLAPVAGAAWACSGHALPAMIGDAATTLGDASTPVALVTIGLFLAAPSPGRGDPVALRRIVVLKLLVEPALIAVLAFAVFHLPARDAAAALLLGALPVGTGPFLLARLYGRAPGITGRAILVTTVLSLATIPALVALLRP